MSPALIVARVRNAWKAVIATASGLAATANEVLPLIPEPAKHYASAALAGVFGVLAYWKRNQPIIDQLLDEAVEPWSDADLAEVAEPAEVGQHEAV